MNEEIKPDFQAGWDMRMAMVQGLYEILQVANADFLHGRMDKYFWGLNLIIRRISPYLTEEETANIKEQESNLAPYLHVFSIDLTNKTDEQKKVIIGLSNKISKKLNNYDETIMYLLNKYGFLVPSKEDKTKLIA